MQHRINPEMDIIAYILEAVLKLRPDDNFCKSLQLQYAERGGLSKKQLEGLQGKALCIPGIHPGRMATLEAIIKKKHVTHRSAVTLTHVPDEKDIAAGEMISVILAKYTQHKRVLLFNSIFNKAGKLSPAEREELVKFYKILIEQKK